MCVEYEKCSTFGFQKQKKTNSFVKKFCIIIIYDDASSLFKNGEGAFSCCLTYNLLSVNKFILHAKPAEHNGVNI